MTQVKFVVRSAAATDRIHRVPFDHSVLPVHPSDDLAQAIRADMAGNGRKWPPIDITVASPNLRSFDLSPDQDLRISVRALTPPVIEGIKRMVDSPDIPDESTVYVIPEQTP